MRVANGIGLAAVVLGCALLGCGAPDRTRIEDPRRYAIDSLSELELHTWWEVYRNRDESFLASVVDEVAAKLDGGLPDTKGKLDLLVRNRIAGRYLLRMDDTDEGRAFILARARERFEAPPSTTWDALGRYALLDYHVLPGVWKPLSRTSEGLMDPPAIGRRPFLKPEVLARSLAQLITAHPEATVYQVRYQYHFGSSLKRVLLEITPGRPLIMREDSSLRFTRTAPSWKELLGGTLELADLDWDSPSELDPGPRLSEPPTAALPSRS